jgi:hypothetical protein
MTALIRKISNWFSTISSPEEKLPRLRKKSSITEALERVALAEKRLITVEEATINLTVADLSIEDLKGYEEDTEEEEDWF